MSEVDASGVVNIAVLGFTSLAQLPDARRVGRLAEMRNDGQAMVNFLRSASARARGDHKRSSIFYKRADAQNHNQYVQPLREALAPEIGG